MNLEDIEKGTTPQQTEFDKFNYSIEDAPIDALKQDLMTLDESINKNLIVQYNDIPSTSELAIRDIYERMSKALGMKVGYTNFKECVENIAENSKVQRDIIEAVNAKIAIDITQRAVAKLIITFNILIDRASAMILRETAGTDAEFTPELVGMCDKCVQWIEQLEDIKERATAKCSDPDKSIVLIMERAQKKLSETSVQGEYDQKILLQLVESLKGEDVKL